jgi:hypothetical protein
MLLMGVYFRMMHEAVFLPKATVPAQMMAVFVLFIFPQNLQAFVMAPVNSVVFGALPIVFTHWVVRFLGGAPATAAGANEHRGFATNAPASS